jgi:hypothetical protein
MFVQSQGNLLASLTAALAGISTCQIRLYSNNYTPTNASLLTNFTEANFTGYTAVTNASWNAPSWAGQGAAVGYSKEVATFQPTGTTITQTVYGYYVTIGSGGGETLLGAELFSSPIPMASVEDQINIVFPMSVGDGSIPGIIY